MNLVFVKNGSKGDCKLEINIEELVARLTAIVDHNDLEIATLSIMSILDEIEDKKMEII